MSKRASRGREKLYREGEGDGSLPLLANPLLDHVGAVIEFNAVLDRRHPVAIDSAAEMATRATRIVVTQRADVFAVLPHQNPESRLARRVEGILHFSGL